MGRLTENATDVRQLLYLLKTSNLQDTRMFLVVDNISSQESVEFVQHILSFGLGTGSKVLLVAHTLDVLRPLLQDYPDNGHYSCGDMHIPSIDEEEATQILLQSGGGLKSCTPRHVLNLIKEVVHTYSFFAGGERCYYIPFVFKIMGGQLRQYEFDVKKWGRELQSFRRKVEVSKEDAVKRLAEKSFEKLPKMLQHLFLDVALFVVPSSPGSMDEVYDLLSIMHESSPDRIEMEMRHLQRCCFLEGFHDNVCTIRVHDVFLEFAASLPESSMYRRNFRNKKVDSLALDQAQASELRAISLKLDEYNSSCRRLDFSASCFSSVRALFLKTCASLETLGLAGLTSLMSLDIANCPKLEWVQLPKSSNSADRAQRLKRPRWETKEDEASQRSVLKRLRLANIELGAAKEMEKGKNVSMSLQRQKYMIQVGGLASQFTGLQILTLENTGIKSLGDMSRCWPQLQKLRVCEQHLEHFKLGGLPKLKCFLFSDRSSNRFLDINELNGGEPFYDSAPSGKLNARALGGKYLFTGCPALEEVRVCSNSFDEGLGTLVGTSKLHTLWIRYSSFQSTSNLAAALPQLLERLVVTNCSYLRSIDFNVSRFVSLREVRLWYLTRLTEITGLDCLPSLQNLMIGSCSKLQTLSGLSGLASLEQLHIQDCSSLQTLSGLSGLASLKNLMIVGCSELQTLSGLSGLASLEQLHIQDCSSLQTLSGLSGLASLENLVIVRCSELQTLSGLSGLASLQQLLIVRGSELQTLSGLSGLASLQQLHIQDCSSLQTLSGLSGLASLQQLHIEGCSELQTLSGLSGLASLQGLLIWECSKLQITSSGLVSLELLNVERGCPNVRVSLNELENLARLKFITCRFECFEAPFNLSNLVGLQKMRIDTGRVDSVPMFAGLERLSHLESLILCSSDDQVKYGSFVDLANLLGVPRLRRPCNFQSMQFIELQGLQNLASLGGIEVLHVLETVYLKNLPNLTCMQGIQFLIHLKKISVEGCASVKELPSLCMLVKMESLMIRGCVKLKAVEGCDAMTRLRGAQFSKCKSLESLPLDHESLRRMSSHQLIRRCPLRIEGCRFASVDAMVAWAVDENVPVLLSRASLIGLIWEFDTNLFVEKRERRALGVLLVQKVVAHFVDRMSAEEHGLAKLEDWANVLDRNYGKCHCLSGSYNTHWRNGVLVGSKPEELIKLLRRLAKKPKEDVLQKCQSDTDFQLSVVDKHLAHTSGYEIKRLINLTGNSYENEL